MSMDKDSLLIGHCTVICAKKIQSRSNGQKWYLNMFEHYHWHGNVVLLRNYFHWLHCKLSKSQLPTDIFVLVIVFPWNAPWPMIGWLCSVYCLISCISRTGHRTDHSQQLQGWLNERRCYFVTTSLIGWAQNYNQPWISTIVPLHAIILRNSIIWLTKA